MKQTFQSRQFKTSLSYFLLAVAIMAAYKIIQEIDIIFNFANRLTRIISPFIYGFLIAYILNIPCGGIQKLLSKADNTFIRKKSRLLSVLITYISVFFILYLILRLIIPSIYNSIYYFIAHYQTYYNSAQEWIYYVNSLDIVNLDIGLDMFMPSARDFNVEKILGSVNALFGVSAALFSIFLAFISSIYVLFEKEPFKQYLCRLFGAFLPGTLYRIALKCACDLNKNFKQYIYTQTIDGCILGTIVTIELYLFDSPYALILGIMLGIVNYIPYFGSIFGSIAAVIVVAFTQNIPTAGIVAIVLLITQQIDGNFIQPKLMGGSFALSPLLIIISITIGGAFYGIFGMLAAIPIIAVIKDMLDELILYFEQKKM